MNKFMIYDKSEQKLKFSPLALTIKAFKDLWDRDNSEDKEVAISELSFCYFAVSMSPDNPYRETDRENRIEQIIEDLYEGSEINAEDPLILGAVEKMKDLDKSVEKELLRTANSSAYKLINFLNSADLEATDKNERPVHDAKKYKSMLDDMSSTVKSLKELKEMVEEGEAEGSNLRGGDKPEFKFDG